MSKNPLNLAFRFLLELAALAAMGYWGWQQGSGWVRFAAAVLVPLAASLLWGTFRVPNDPGKAPVPVRGFVRLLLEAAFFSFAVWGLFDAGAAGWGWVFAAALLVHYMLSYDRISWLLRQ